MKQSYLPTVIFALYDIYSNMALCNTCSAYILSVYFVALYMISGTKWWNAAIQC